MENKLKPKPLIVFDIMGLLIINTIIKAIEINIAVWFNFEIAVLLIFLSSFILRYLVIILYDHLEDDKFGIEHIKEKHKLKQEITHSTSITRKIMKYKKMGNLFLFLCIVLTDPIITVLWYREGYYLWNNIPDKKTFCLFLTSIIWGTALLSTTVYYFGGSISRLLSWLISLI